MKISTAQSFPVSHYFIFITSRFSQTISNLWLCYILISTSLDRKHDDKRLYTDCNKIFSNSESLCDDSYGFFNVVLTYLRFAIFSQVSFLLPVIR